MDSDHDHWMRLAKEEGRLAQAGTPSCAAALIAAERKDTRPKCIRGRLNARRSNMPATRIWLVIAFAWVSSLVAVGVFAQARGFTPLPEPRIFSGDDVGFRVEGMHGNVPAGNVVIRVNGEWVEAQVGGRTMPAPAGSK